MLILPPFFTKPSNTFLEGMQKVLDGFVARNPSAPYCRDVGESRDEAKHLLGFQ